MPDLLKLYTKEKQKGFIKFLDAAFGKLVINAEKLFFGETKINLFERNRF